MLSTENLKKIKKKDKKFQSLKSYQHLVNNFITYQHIGIKFLVNNLDKKNKRLINKILNQHY